MIKIEDDFFRMQQISHEDWLFFYSLYQDPQVMKFVSDRQSEEQIRASFDSRLPLWHKNSTHWLCLVIYCQKTHQRMGVTGFKVFNEHNDKIAEVGYLIAPEFSGRGVASRTLAKVIEFATQQLKLTKFRAVVTQGNIGSEKTLEKNGFRLTEVISNNFQIGGENYDDHCYSLAFIDK